MTEYVDRDVSGVLARALATMPVVVLTGLRQAGKTTLLEHGPQLGGRRYHTLDDFAVLEAARSRPESLLEGEAPVTIDEAQRAPNLLLAVKRHVDRARRPGRVLLSGSAALGLGADVAESLAGRAAMIRLPPFSRREILRSTGEPFLPRFLESPEVAPEQSPAPIAAEEILGGGLPPVALGQVADRSVWLRGYEQSYLERDVRALSQVADLVAFRTLLQLTALRTGKVLNVSELARDAKLSVTTARRYLGLLEASFVIEPLAPFLRSRTTRLIKSPKLHMSDAGLAAHLAGADDLSAGTDEPLRGALLETYVAHNLRAILEAHLPQARLSYWHVQGRHEVDFIIEVGRNLVAVEVKGGSRWTKRDLAGLTAFLGATPSCRAGVLAYNGTEAVRLAERLWVLPLAMLLS